MALTTDFGVPNLRAEGIVLEAVSKPHNGHFRWFSRDDRTRETGRCVIADRPAKLLVNTSAVSFETDS